MTARVDLWTWRVDGPVEPRHLAVLNTQERARAARYRYPSTRDAFIASRGRTRMILSNYAGAAPEALSFEHGPHGKPVLCGGAGPVFNFSDSGVLGCLAVVIAGAGPLGVDIEFMRPRDYLKLAKRFFAPAEHQLLASLDESEHAHAFFRGWTRKEAFLKAVGTGLSTPLHAFEATITRDAPARLQRIDGAYFPDVEPDPGAWRLHVFDPAPGYMGAIAMMTGGADMQVVVRETPEADVRR